MHKNHEKMYSKNNDFLEMFRECFLMIFGCQNQSKSDEKSTPGGMGSGKADFRKFIVLLRKKTQVFEVLGVPKILKNEQKYSPRRNRKPGIILGGFLMNC